MKDGAWMIEDEHHSRGFACDDGGWKIERVDHGPWMIED